LRMPRSSTMSSGTVVRCARVVLRVPASCAVGELVDERVGLAVEDAMALLR